ncbi:Capsular exopolysaccharide family protein [Hyella patelloides LEGE 07179]|uniref:non-specific protein-tyrosine kinase n=1 Tax=Hyella patelloides LEGE 07179 TaxID=945734 RepID=A0A563VS48_9CYAN|nr:polysaccharide biosynthesis tyrosine autokinase [Hyella patelloides]VEP14284.1 Capsular exopolysaccharide family protein [Hyella patelloides LEGE 07179]
MNTIEQNVHIDEYLDFQKYWLVLKRRWLPATLTLCGVLGISLGYALSQEQIYEAEAKVLIKSNKTDTLSGFENETGNIEVISEESDPLATEAEILRSRPILEKLIKELDLRDEGGELIRYQSFRESFQVRPITGTDILNIRYEGNDPEVVASVVNQALMLYKDQDRLSNRTEAVAARTFITEQLPQVKANVQEAESELRKFKNQYQIANLTEETSATINSISNIRSQIDTIEAELEDVNARYSALNSQLGISWEKASAIATLSQSLAVQTIYERLQQVKVELASTRNYLSNNAPQVISLQEEAAELEQVLNQEIAQTLGGEQQALLGNTNILALGESEEGQINEFANLGLERKGLQKRLAAFNKIYSSNQERSSILPQLEEEQKELVRRVEASQTTYETLLNKLQEIQIAEEQDIGKARVVSEAVVPEFPIGPQKKMMMITGGAIGTLLGIAVAFLIDIRDNTIKNTREAEQMLPYPLRGVIPDCKGITQGKQQPVLAESSSAITDDGLILPVKEAFQDIQINLQLLDPKERIKTIAITSAVAQEGKSSVSANYAIAQAQCGKRILLIDGDLRRSSQHDLWQIPNQIGLTNVLNQEAEWYEGVQNVRPNLDVLTAGTTPDNPIALLDSLSMAVLMMKLLENYDRIIFDTPPLVGLADAKILSKLVDGLLFVVRPGVASYDSIAAAKKVLETAQFNVLGVITNGVDVAKEPYGYEHYYPDKKYLEATK